MCNIVVPVSISKTQYYINQAYIDYLKEAGYTVILVTPGADVLNIAAIGDGLLLPGGIDIDPIYYGEDNDDSREVDPEKDAFERSLFYAFAAVNKPIFGICRGFQLIVREFMRHDKHIIVKRNLEFSQNVMEHQQSSEGIKRTNASHFVETLIPGLYGPDYVFDPDNGYKGIIYKDGTTAIPVNSMHHQALIFNPVIGKTEDNKKEYVDFDDGYLTDNLRVLSFTERGTSYKNDDIIIEAIAIENWPKEGNKIKAVQWHPEELRDYALLHETFGKPVKKDITIGNQV